MKFSIKRSEFLKSLADVQRAISSRTTIPILTGIKIQASEEGLTLTGSDSDISIEAFIPVEDEKNNLTIDQAGSIVLQARFFSEIVKKLPDEMMQIEVLDHFQTLITSANASFTVNGLDANNYPHLPVIDTQETFSLPINLFKQIIGQTVIAISTHESRPILTGVNMVIENGKLLAVATDSHRLSQRIIPLEVSSALADQKYNIIIPGKSLIELSRTLDERHENIEMMITENQVLFKTENMYFYSRLLEGYYPDTARLIPESAATEIVFNASSLLGSIERASLLSHEGKNNVVKISISPELVEISGNSPDVGNVKEELAYISVEGESIDLSFNPDYMKDALRTFGQTDIRIKFTSPVRPFILVPSEDNQNFIQLITPVRTF
ncbi:DNA polymerase III subunit beta [Carnobacterium divergens]|uniref:Beta sliding clamp n=2 Tax=Carnobacterium divergens TaxID=2748 RepID=A0A0R2I6T2_CARDV|nr:DNA polymerase III subunit beta [Carnobacterium divergens]ANZ98783.1 DNA polymerase III subunit beta [Carnobacterium divergens]KRN57524.1 DNA polymerase III, beta subunit [Carnobacterium divergens DSM 20623]MDO0875728.1 DNA polymerase III subunit beta [Carnobacterium divergens]MDT1958701.1 DNA polymerase III subunit beta [Carnobacterium divergens]MDT1974581.1 DNA polymerase III subunit beta [Carnobacterium divergens]